mgnify:CR=1 FL=1
MAVVRTKRDDYLCLSGDVKPTTGISTGTTITEIDTGARFIWYIGTWEEDLTMIYAITQARQ